VDAGEILIAVDTAGAGRWDADVREGYFAERKPHFPMVLGFDGAGTVAAVGSWVRRLKVGNEVYSYNWQNPNGGLYAEYVVVPAEGRADSGAPRSAACRCDPDHGVDRAAGH
jgi:NADPH:quinone reductase-like Zn-dependent oxidoreductase